MREHALKAIWRQMGDHHTIANQINEHHAMELMCSILGFWWIYLFSGWTFLTSLFGSAVKVEPRYRAKAAYAVFTVTIIGVVWKHVKHDRYTHPNHVSIHNEKSVWSCAICALWQVQPLHILVLSLFDLRSPAATAIKIASAHSDDAPL